MFDTLLTNLNDPVHLVGFSMAMTMFVLAMVAVISEYIEYK